VEKVKKINAVALRLKNVSFKEALIKELSEMFYHVGFEEKLDAQEHLIGFENGVYDLDAGKFRDGDPDDFVSFSTGYDYVPFNAAHPCTVAIQDFFEKVFRIENVRKYVMHTIAACLHGGVKNERYMIWYGEQGANGKSKLLDLVEKTFGDYSVKFPISMLTQKRVASNAATSELARSKGRRFASMQEPGENEVLNIGLMKELSGNDKIVARHLFHEPIEFRPFYKMFMCCNQLPAVHSQDGGTWRRIRVVQFTSKFCENPDPENPNEFVVDYDLSNKFEEWKPHMMATLLSVFPAVRGGIHEPEEIHAYTHTYRKENDSVAEFCETCVRACDDADALVTSASLWTDYSSWKKRQNIMRNVQRADFRTVVDKIMGPKNSADGTGWTGYAVVNELE
jgi:P4 family phage/plasmid primase-like protien